MKDIAFLSERTEHWTRLLTAIPSVTGSQDEADFAGKFATLLRQSPAFPKADGVWTVDVAGGPHRRSCVLGLVRGRSKETVVLTGHFDVVETSGYGELEPLAFDPDRLEPALIERLSGEPADPRSTKALDDLRSGDFIAARGLLDMKAGLAAGLAVIELLARQGSGHSLLFIGVPDEEGNSAGARHMSQALAGIAAERGLDIVAAINLDASGDEGDGEGGRVIMLGSVGKVLPSALVVGRASHAADSFRGFGAAALAGALAAELEWHPDLTERTGDELGAAPTLLGMKDSKQHYDVTTPASVWMYWNVMTHRRSPEQVMRTVEEAARRCAAAVTGRLLERAGTSAAQVILGDIPVLRFETLLAEVSGKNPAVEDHLRSLSDSLAGTDLSLPEQNRRLTERLWELSGRAGPAIVLGFASIPYLPVELRDDERARNLHAAVLRAAETTAEAFQTTIGTIRYFPGISDVSFFGQPDDSHVATIAANTPAWRTVLAGAEKFGAAGIPSINVGPWGRDYHTRLERMHKDYGFRVLPALILEIVRRLA